MTGRAWVFGDELDTDLLAPGAYMKGPIETLAGHVLEAVDPGFATAVQPGDILVAGRNFGIGSSREQAAEALKVLGLAAVVARSFGGIFYRNAFNLGLPAIECDGVAAISTGDRLTLDAAGGRIRNETTGEVLTCLPVPAHLMRLVQVGGLLNHLAAQQEKSP